MTQEIKSVPFHPGIRRDGAQTREEANATQDLDDRRAKIISNRSSAIDNSKTPEVIAIG